MTDFEIVGKIEQVKTIARGSGVKARQILNKRYGRHRWFKRKGIALVQFPIGDRAKAEIHWYDAHGVPKKMFKIKQVLEDI